LRNFLHIVFPTATAAVFPQPGCGWEATNGYWLLCNFIYCIFVTLPPFLFRFGACEGEAWAVEALGLPLLFARVFFDKDILFLHHDAPVCSLL
jgi:hypothetical protein